MHVKMFSIPSTEKNVSKMSVIQPRVRRCLDLFNNEIYSNLIFACVGRSYLNEKIPLGEFVCNKRQISFVGIV